MASVFIPGAVCVAVEPPNNGLDFQLPLSPLGGIIIDTRDNQRPIVI
jgi:hypothetical protein